MYLVTTSSGVGYPSMAIGRRPLGRVGEAVVMVVDIHMAKIEALSSSHGGTS